MSRGMNRAMRLKTMEMLYMERAYTDQEMADELGVRRETAYQDRIELETEDEIPFVEVEHGRRKIDRTKYLPNIKVTLHEALALYLAMRRVSRQTRTAQPHVQRALEKLALALKQPMTERLIRVAAQLAQQPGDTNRVKVMEDLAQGWAQRQKVRIHYEALTGSAEKVHLINPYLIEPSNWSDAIYVIAQSDRMSKPTPFNVARITHTFVTGETFELPEDFDEQELLRYAWGIWTRDRAPEIVKLKFTGPEAIKRVKETIWHPLQAPPQDQPDGSCIWEAPIAEWQEMLPWIRGWGADVEVLAPKELREKLRREAQNMAKVYGVMEQKPMEKHWLLWAKADKKTQQVHRLIYHMIDVGQVALALWNTAVPDPVRNQLVQSLNLNSAKAGRLIAFWASMHDLGKASPSFQFHKTLRKTSLGQELKQALESAGLIFPLTYPQDQTPHQFITTWAIQVERPFSQLAQINDKVVDQFAQIVGGHHGAWPPSDQINRMHPADKGDETWTAVRRELVTELFSVFQPPIVDALALSIEARNAFFTLVSGLVSVADWIGSDENCFGYVMDSMPLTDYVRRSEKQAPEPTFLARLFLLQA